MAILICYVVPLDIAFGPYWCHSTWWIVSELVIEGFFVLDIMVHLLTTIYDHDGNEIFDRMIIAKKYLLSSHFWLDLLSTIRITNNVFFRLLPILKVIKVTNLSHIIKEMDITNRQKAKIKAVQLFFYHITYLHIKTCISFYVTK